MSAGVLVAALLGAGCDPAGYRAIQLPNPGGGDAPSSALEVNEAGDVLGQVGPSDPTGKLVVWRDDGAIVSLPLQPSRSPRFNDRGDVAFMEAGQPKLWSRGMVTTIPAPRPSIIVGLDERGRVLLYVSSATPGDPAGTTMLFAGGRLRELPGFVSPDGTTFVQPTAMNDAGQVIGFLFPFHGPSFPSGSFIWENGHLTELSPFPGGTGNTVFAINDAGQVAGTSGTADNQGHAYLWEDGVMTDVGDLGGIQSSVTGLGPSGHVIGLSGRTDGTLGAYVWHDGVLRDLGSLTGAGESPLPMDVNATGQVVGTSPTAGGDIHGFVWDDGVLTDLLTLGGPTSSARSINDRGQIAGTTTTPDGTTHAALWNPTPATLPG
jgi:probable HAF family extracellular repeat protein